MNGILTEAIPAAMAMETCAAGEDIDLYDTVCEGALSGEEMGPLGLSDVISDQQDQLREHLCPPGKHMWKHELCMVCTVCRECTGYSISCLSSMRPDRNPGQ